MSTRFLTTRMLSSFISCVFLSLYFVIPDISCSGGQFLFGTYFFLYLLVLKLIVKERHLHFKPSLFARDVFILVLITEIQLDAPNNSRRIATAFNLSYVGMMLEMSLCCYYSCTCFGFKS